MLDKLPPKTLFTNIKEKYSSFYQKIIVSKEVVVIISNLHL